jgi:hypothetical protein
MITKLSNHLNEIICELMLAISGLFPHIHTENEQSLLSEKASVMPYALQ